MQFLKSCLKLKYLLSVCSFPVLLVIELQTSTLFWLHVIASPIVGVVIQRNLAPCLWCLGVCNLAECSVLLVMLLFYRVGRVCLCTWGSGLCKVHSTEPLPWQPCVVFFPLQRPDFAGRWFEHCNICNILLKINKDCASFWVLCPVILSSYYTLYCPLMLR